MCCRRIGNTSLVLRCPGCGWMRYPLFQKRSGCTALSASLLRVIDIIIRKVATGEHPGLLANVEASKHLIGEQTT